MRRTGIVRDNRYLEHKTGVHHIEIPQRLETIYKTIDHSELHKSLIPIAPRLASLEEIEWVHTPDYIEKILDTADEPIRYLDPDTVTSEKTCEAAFLAAGGVFEAVEQIVTGTLDNGFALVRPPGHHAERNRQMGFCIFNNVALAAEYARRRHGLERILIIDWDLHHANGTQHIFDRDPGVLLFSSHRFPFFPGTGDFAETGSGPGEGFTINVPMPAQQDDSDFLALYERLLVPVALEFNPQLVLVSAGFDTHYDDPIGGMKVTEQGYAGLTEIILGIADQTCEGKMLALIEGGYDLGAMRKSAAAVLETLLLGSVPEHLRKKTPPKLRASSPTPDIIKKVKETHGPFWKSLDNV